MHYRLTITVEQAEDGFLKCRISDDRDDLFLLYKREEGGIEFLERNRISELIQSFSFQFHKVMQSALYKSVEPGHRIFCVFIDDFLFLKDRDYDHFILMDRRRDSLKISVSDKALSDAEKIYADGSFLDSNGRAGYGGFIEDARGKRVEYSRCFDSGSSNLMELLGVSEGLERLKDCPLIQINTDSRFVIRGLVQWVHFWRYNNWQTAYGRSVKYAEHWRRIDGLCEGKLIQFNWIKGHSGDEGQDYCHRLAQSSVLKGPS